MILAIDTSLGSAVAVVDRDGRVLGEASSADTRGHAEIIGDLLERALRDAAATPADIDHVAAGMGPGPFTGLRIGIAAARVFALGRGVPLVPVASHDAAALTHFDGAPPAGPVAITTDARRRELAYTVYRGMGPGGLPERTSEPDLCPQGDLDARLAAAGIARVDVDGISAAALGRVASRMIATDAVATASEPLYLRSPDVTVGGPRKRVGV